jgi:hypothetical protein
LPAITGPLSEHHTQLAGGGGGGGVEPM